MSAGFHGPSFGSKVSRWLGAAVHVDEDAGSRRVPRLYARRTAGRFRIRMHAEQRGRRGAEQEMPPRSEACPPQVFQFCFIIMASVIEREIELVEQRPLQVAEPLIARTGCGAASPEPSPGP